MIIYSQWIMETAFWRDGGQWDDRARWHDYPYLYNIWIDSLYPDGLWTDRPEPEGVVILPPV